MVSPDGVGNRSRLGLTGRGREPSCMALRRRGRTAAASGISLLLHGLFLAAMVYGVRAVKPPPEAPPIEIQLIAPFVQPKLTPAISPSPAPSSASQRAQPSRPA